MRFSDILHTCGQNLFRRKSRTILTVLGVIVGCCSIVLMISIGQGINERNEQMLKSMGSLNVITVYAGSGSQGGGGYAEGMGSASSSEAKLNDDAVQSFRNIAGVSGVLSEKTLQYTVDATAGVGNRYVTQYLQVMGVNTAQLEASGYTLKSGRLPSRSGEVLVGEKTVYNFLDKYRSGADNQRTAPGGYVCDENGECRESEGEEPFFDMLTTKMTLITGANYQSPDDYRNVGSGVASGSDTDGGAGQQTSTISNEYTPVGVVKSSGNDYDALGSGVVMTMDDMKSLMAKAANTSVANVSRNFTYDQIVVRAENIKDVPNVEAQIKSMGYQTSSFEQTRKELEKQTQGIQLALGGIGGVAFLVAAIGIANTMIMSVSERTREIGIMKALGCYVRDIRVTFLCEAGAIGLIGGVIGCLISALGSLAINLVALQGFSWENIVKAIVGGDDVSRSSVIPWWLFASAIVFSIAVGVIAGFGPANKAVRIPALDAIKNDQ
jgi:putative ABC transport system permease protein